MLDAPVELRLAGSMWRAVTAPRAEFEIRVDSAGHEFEAEGTVADGRLEGAVRSAGQSIPVSLQVGRLLGGSDDLFALLPSREFAPGEEASFPGFDPLTLRPATARARCLRLETLTLDGAPVATRVVEVTAGKATITAWLDGEGGVVQAEAPFGITLRRFSRADAIADAPRGGASRAVRHLPGDAHGSAPPSRCEPHGGPIVGRQRPRGARRRHPETGRRR